MLDSMQDPSLLLTAVRDDSGAIKDFRVLVANQAARSFTAGYTDQLVGIQIWKMINRPEGTWIFDAFVDTVKSGQPLAIDSAKFGGVVGAEDRRFDIRAAKVGDGLSSTWRDVTERWTAAQALAVAEEHYQLIAENASDIVFRSDLDARVQWISPSVQDVLGQHPDEVVGRLATDFIHPDDVPLLLDSTQALRLQASSRYDARFVTSEGGYRWMSVFAAPVKDKHGVVVGRTGSFRDIHIEMETRAALRRSEQQLRSAIDATPIGSAIVGTDRNFIEVNAALCRMLGYDRSWFLTNGMADVVGRHDDDMDKRLRAAAVESDIGTATSEKRLRRSDGSEIWVEHSVGVIRDDAGTVVSYISQYVDITDSRSDADGQSERERLRHEATHDSLTHLANRRELMYRANLILSHPRRDDSKVALAFVDLDGLKAVNDQKGHLVGDALIVAVAERIRHCVRSEDLVARFGGDEFVVLFPDVRTVDDALALAENLRASLNQPISTDQETLTISASIGVTIVDTAETLTAAIERADAAMYEAKRRGRNQTVLHHDPIV
jgi:diguanylate cyclase (GGDEF)-like protein/PAS domain S-box-containing protein